MRKILLALNFRPIVTVDKTRRRWVFEDYEVALDKVVGLGDFVEVEYKGSMVVDPKTTTKEMVVFLKNNGCGKIELNNGGYPMLLLFPNDAHYIEV
jgi:adenylate cyclase class 2